MTKKATGIVAYCTWIGWIVAFCAGDKEGAKFQLNQTLVLWIAAIIVGILEWVPVPVIKYIASIVYIALVVFWIIGFVGACKGEDREIPLLSKITILK